MAETASPALRRVLKAPDLHSLDGVLTKAMQQQQHQALIRGENLGHILTAIEDLASGSPWEEEIFAAAVLGRLAAVARGREAEVHARVKAVFSSEPPSIESLSNADEKTYAARMLTYVDAEWVVPYCARESFSVSAPNARKELFATLLSKTGDISACIRMLADASDVVQDIEKDDTRIKRVRRILEALAEVARTFEGNVGSGPGVAMAKLTDNLVRGATEADTDALHASLDAALSVLVRIIELRYSHALQSETYQLVHAGKKLLGQGPWRRFIEGSAFIGKIQMNLLETAIVLARQNRTDKEILRAMEAAWSSTTMISAALKRHFATAVDIDPEIADYWLKVGRVSQNDRAIEHKLGNIEDQQIGELLIQLAANRESMSKLNTAVVPVLEMFDPFQSATVQRAANGYESIAQVAERLARLRRLSMTDIRGLNVEYNPIEHDMEGGHRSGVRRVRVTREGILKEFGGKKKTLVKPRVESEE